MKRLILFLIFIVAPLAGGGYWAWEQGLLDDYLGNKTSTNTTNKTAPIDRGDQSNSNRFYFTSQSEEKIPDHEAMSEFDCSEMIYAVAEFKDLEKGEHTFEVLWNDPTRNQREKTEFPIVHSSGTKRVWAWIKLHRPTGSSFFSFFDPTAGMEDFIGEWNVIFKLDGKNLGEKKFYVDC